jgi:hypothetical protein
MCAMWRLKMEQIRCILFIMEPEEYRFVG